MSSNHRSVYRPKSSHKPQSSYFTKPSTNSTTYKDFRDRPPFQSNNSKPIPKIKPNFKPSGLLAKESNNINGIQLKYVAPDDALESVNELKKNYYLYIYTSQSRSDSEPIKVHLNTSTSHLIGRDAKVCDITISEESVSKQHAVIQFRQVQLNNNSVIKAYVMDLDSSNGTELNKDELPQGRFVELINGDVLRFGEGHGEFVFMVAE
ncbi:hypothetical protein WICPIJ_009780 [Wickerhamomyces pijperi]|uniref:FHA domain-containing protein n=1 Tax=Wickerhamomyces pijperi TaxID=599730 RepID=A0A9P8PL58_WICPI|nr:hypothetical protein WICPIJ_009780 [Wickerhamomyces pijperi]